MPTILIAGGTGLVGKRLSTLLKERQYEVLHLSRRSNPKAVFPTYCWDPATGFIEPEAVKRADYIINLAGAGIADARWTAARKRLIIESRVQSAELLQTALQSPSAKARAYISAAAIGYYGNSGDQLVDETSPAGEGFLAESCTAWEDSIQKVATATGLRTVGLRIGIVLSTQGGALEKMLIPLRFGLNTYFGNGRQWYSWVHIDDVCRLFIAAIENAQMAGMYNAVAPNPVSNYQLSVALGKAWARPAVLLPAPAFALRLAMGEMAEVVLNSNCVSADKALATGFEFQHPHLDEALSDVLRRKV